jgi:hypothetical protein
MHPTAGPSLPLSARLRALRQQTWPGRVITQAQLAAAFQAERSTSVPLISSWESSISPKPPPLQRLEAYARLFATERSIQNGVVRLLPVDELTDAERSRYDELLIELTALVPAYNAESHAGSTPQKAPAGLCHFPDGYDILIVCARLPDEVTRMMGSYTNPTDPDYVALYTYADPDALVELFGHLRALNPTSSVTFKTIDKLEYDDYVKHLFLLGGVDYNHLTRVLFTRLGLPVRQVTRLGTEDEPSYFEATDGGVARKFAPVLRDGVLLEDVAHFYRGANPFNAERKVTICNGMFGRGTHGVVRALTDGGFRDRNDEYVADQLDRHGAFSLLMRVEVMYGAVLTPDWTIASTRLHEWPEVQT